MIGSDAVIAGMVGDKCFAYSYFLTAKEQCNYEGPQVRHIPFIPSCNNNMKQIPKSTNLWSLSCIDDIPFLMTLSLVCERE